MDITKAHEWTYLADMPFDSVSAVALVGYFRGCNRVAAELHTRDIVRIPHAMIRA